MQTPSRRAALIFVSAFPAAAILTGCASTTPGPVGADALLGTWRLVSFEMELQSSTGRLKPMGNVPTGYLSFMSDGRMAVVITGEGRKLGNTDQERSALFTSLVAYAGRFRVEGDKFITKVDVASNPAFVGTDQSRTFKVTGNTLEEASDWIRRVDNTNVRVFNVYERVK